MSNLPHSKDPYDAIELSLVVPCFNEEMSIEPFVNALSGVLARLPATEVIFVDDGSKDRTCQMIESLAQRPSSLKAIRLVRLSRNFGHQLALLAGMREARGRACVTMDVDLQDPPEVITQMVAMWKQGYQVVLGQRESRDTDSWFKRTTAHLFYKLMSSLTRGDFPAHVGDFRLVDRKVLNILIRLPELGLYWRGLSIWVGFKRGMVQYTRAARAIGESKFPFSKMALFALNAVFSFSKKPLYLSTYAGMGVSMLSMLILFAYILIKLFSLYDLVPGWLSLLCVITFIGGLQLFCLGIIGQYVGRIYEQVLGRPAVLVDEVIEVTGA